MTKHTNDSDNAVAQAVTCLPKELERCRRLIIYHNVYFSTNGMILVPTYLHPSIP